MHVERNGSSRIAKGYAALSGRCLKKAGSTAAELMRYNEPCEVAATEELDPVDAARCFYTRRHPWCEPPNIEEASKWVTHEQSFRKMSFADDSPGEPGCMKHKSDSVSSHSGREGVATPAFSDRSTVR